MDMMDSSSCKGWTWPADWSRASLFDNLSSPVRAKVVCCRSHNHLGIQFQTIQPLGSHPQALQIATQTWQMVSLWEFYTPAEVQVSIF